MQYQRVAVLGMGVSGRSAAEFLMRQGVVVCGIDRNAESLKCHPEVQSLQDLGMAMIAESAVQNVKEYDLLIISPGIPSSHPLIIAAQNDHIPCMGEIELGCRFAKNPIIGITGTNGKTTVTLLVTHILNQCEQTAIALGNVGTPLTKELLTLDSNTCIVLELSSYQLETLQQPCLQAGVVLNITPDHLDRYQTMENYAKAKWGMRRAIKTNDFLYVEEKAWEEYRHLLPSSSHIRLYGYSPSSFIYTDLSSLFREGKVVFELPSSLKGKKSHELENLMAAYALCSDRGIASQAFLLAQASFRKPPHRIEWIGESQGVHYFDDSKGTNIDAVIRAVQSIDGPIVLIAGGVDKGFPYTSWITPFTNKVKSIYAIGQSAQKISTEISAHIPVKICHSLDEALSSAMAFAQKGDNVLLSPGCSSFDMFRDYAHRGEEFQRLFKKLSR